MLKFKTNLGSATFALMMVTVTIATSLMLNRLIYPPTWWPAMDFAVVVFVLIVTPPLALTAGMNIRNSNIATLKLERIRNTDYLSRVMTRDYFFAKLEADVNMSGVLAMVDIDHFKSVNDTFGHMVGDDAIRETARLVKSGIGEGDLVCRFGGEEFLVFWNGLELSAAAAAAERLRSKIEQNVIHSGHSELKVTVSIGLAQKARAQDLSAQIEKADRALYVAKKSGRNRVEKST